MQKVDLELLSRTRLPIFMRIKKARKREMTTLRKSETLVTSVCLRKKKMKLQFIRKTNKKWLRQVPISRQ